MHILHTAMLTCSLLWNITKLIRVIETLFTLDLWYSWVSKSHEKIILAFIIWSLWLISSFHCWLMYLLMAIQLRLISCGKDFQVHIAYSGPCIKVGNTRFYNNNNYLIGKIIIFSLKTCISFKFLCRLHLKIGPEICKFTGHLLQDIWKWIAKL